MPKYRSLRDFLEQNPPTINRICYDGGLRNANEFPLYGIRVNGAVLFADLPGYSALARRCSAEECAFMTNHFFAWIEAAAIRYFGGIVDKFIGDEVMIIFASDFAEKDPLDSALRTAKMILEADLFAFEPKIGVASGDFLIAAVGTRQRFDVSAIGHTVNLAARCVGKAEPSLIKIATTDRELTGRIFEHESWEIEGPQSEDLKNVGKAEIITIRRNGFRILSFDYEQMVRNAVADAQDPTTRQEEIPLWKWQGEVEDQGNSA
jgi:class 3 adenylate cyclase